MATLEHVTARIAPQELARVEAFGERIGVGQAAAIRLLLRAGLNAVDRDPAFLLGASADPAGQHRAITDGARHRAVTSPPGVDELTPASRQRAQELGLLPPQA